MTVDLPTIYETWRRQWTGEPDDEAIETRATYLASLDPNRRTAISNNLEAYHAGNNEAIQRYLFPFVDQIDPIVDCSSLLPERLFDLAGLKGDRNSLSQTRFEALQAYDVAATIEIIDHADSWWSVSRDQGLLLDLLNPELFRDEDLTLPVWSYHEGVELLASEVSVGHDLHRHHPKKRRTSYKCRVLKDGTPVWFDHRLKGRFETYLKIHRQRVQHKKLDPYLVLDRCGLIYVVETVATAEFLIAEVRRLIESAGGRFVLTDNRLRNGNGREREKRSHKANPNRSDEYRAAWADVFYKGRWFEIQFTLFVSDASARYSLSTVNHELYRQDQWREIFAPIMFPQKARARPLYGIRWDHKHTRQELRRFMISKLGWHFNQLPAE